MQNQTSNTAILTFEYGSQSGCAISNVATMTLEESITIKNRALDHSYYLEDAITYIITINNNNNSVVKNLKITDDLGSYNSDNTISKSIFTPLSYVGPSQLYTNGVFTSNIMPETGISNLVFNISSVPANSNVNIIYKAMVNNKALLKIGSELTNHVTLSLDSINNLITNSNTIPVSERANVRIIKHMCPGKIIRGECVTYNFSLYNYGNTEAVNVSFKDTFSPAPAIKEININSKKLTFSDYLYTNGALSIPAYNSNFSLSIPPAEFIQNPMDGSVNINPGMTEIIVFGII